MTRKQIKQRLIHLQGAEMAKGAPEHYALRVAKRAMVEELKESGLKSSEASYEIYKAEKENQDSA